jgi:hypothetical protein
MKGAVSTDLIHFALLIGSRATTTLIGRGRSWTAVLFAQCPAVTRPLRIPPIEPSAGASVI